MCAGRHRGGDRLGKTLHRGKEREGRLLCGATPATPIAFFRLAPLCNRAIRHWLHRPGGYLVKEQPPGISAVEFQRQLGLRDETVFQLLHKLRAGVVRPERDTNGKKRKKTLDAARLPLRLTPNYKDKTLTGFVQNNLVNGAGHAHIWRGRLRWAGNAGVRARAQGARWQR